MNDVQVLPVPRKRNNFAFGFFAVVIVAFVALFARGVMLKSAPPLAGIPAPQFALTTFEGQSYRLEELRGRPILLNFWASWCKPCRDEAPILKEVWETYKSQGLLVIGVDYLDTEADAKKFMQEFGITYPNGPDVQLQIASTYRITGVPETYFIDRNGNLLFGSDATGRAYGNWIGPIPREPMLERVKRLVAR